MLQQHLYNVIERVSGQGIVSYRLYGNRPVDNQVLDSWMGNWMAAGSTMSCIGRYNRSNDI